LQLALALYTQCCQPFARALSAAGFNVSPALLGFAQQQQMNLRTLQPVVVIQTLGVDHGDHGLTVLGDDLFRAVLDLLDQVGPIRQRSRKSHDIFDRNSHEAPHSSVVEIYSVRFNVQNYQAVLLVAFLARQASEQYNTDSQFLAHALRHVMVRPHTAQGLLGRDCLLPLKSFFMDAVIRTDRLGVMARSGL